MLEGILLTIITAATPLLFAAIGELVTERSGVLNLGVEGMMAMGAVVGFAVAHTTGSFGLGILGAIFAGMAMAALFGVVTLIFVANQVASGLALTLFGLGLSGLIGDAFVGVPGAGLARVSIPVLSDLPVVGLLFRLDPLTYLAIAITIGVSWFLFRMRGGLILRAVGDSHASAHALGYSVIRVRFMAVLFGGACSGLAGAYLSLVYTPQWTQAMTAGRGWIALALVVFATWLPRRVLIGALLFGGVSILQLHAQALGVGVPSQFLSALPYLTTIVVLVIISRNRALVRANTPAALGQSFVPDR
ncbi:ABC transporter permease [Kaistia sp. 32K]|uniref:ABC transporter permease n=1 Tax=Kaistia sp. 32K TaxID=2795690 RepID=UPI001914E559|nr:ABC transporter permease [Kaistia sp. 32K]